MKVSLLKVSEKAIKEYKAQVKDNQETPDDQVIRKLTRNVQLVKEKVAKTPYLKQHLIEESLFTKIYKYGNLHIYLRFGKVVKVLNHRGKNTQWHRNHRRYNELNRQLGITH